MKSLNEQFYSQLREAMFENKLSASDLSAARGVHYTYIFNTIRKNANVTIESASKLADAAGYDLCLTFLPRPGRGVLSGKMDAQGKLYSHRRPSKDEEVAEAPVVVNTAITDAEVAELLALSNA